MLQQDMTTKQINKKLHFNHFTPCLNVHLQPNYILVKYFALKMKICRRVNRNVCAVNNPSLWDKLSEDRRGPSVCMCLSVGLCVSYRQDPC